MIIERHAVLTLLMICATAVGTRFFLRDVFSWFLLLAALGFALVCLIRSRNKMKELSDAEEMIAAQRNGLHLISEAIEKIGDNDHATQSIAIDGDVGEALRNLQSKLHDVKKEEAARMWAAQGIAIIGEIRKDNSSLEDYSFQIINQLVKYLGANQGAFYSLEGEGADRRLELLSAYAYERRKHTSEKVVIDIGQGLVGQCVLEKEMIFMTDVPQDYLKITSGLGESTPRCISIVPLVHRDQVFGVIELASFTRFEKYHLEFINKVCDGVALELSGVRSQERTRKLLEQSQEQELRQRLKEIESEQRKNEAILEGCMDAVVSFNEEGSVEYFNKAAEEIFGYSRREIIGTPVENILNVLIERNHDGSALIRSTKGNEVTVRTEINANSAQGEELALLLTATKVKLGNHYLFTLFAQKISVDLF